MLSTTGMPCRSSLSSFHPSTTNRCSCSSSEKLETVPEGELKPKLPPKSTTQSRTLSKGASPPPPASSMTRSLAASKRVVNGEISSTTAASVRRTTWFTSRGSDFAVLSLELESDIITFDFAHSIDHSAETLNTVISLSESQSGQEKETVHLAEDEQIEQKHPCPSPGYRGRGRRR